MIDTLLHTALVLAMPPLLLGVIGKTKAAFAGRVGAPFLQPYYDLSRLMGISDALADLNAERFRAFQPRPLGLGGEIHQRAEVEIDFEPGRPSRTVVEVVRHI